jgi:hypothetical protein
MDAKPVTLAGPRVRLVPIGAEHLDALADAGAFAELWRWTRAKADTSESMKAYVDEAHAEVKASLQRFTQPVARA